MSNLLKHADNECFSKNIDHLYYQMKDDYQFIAHDVDDIIAQGKLLQVKVVSTDFSNYELIDVKHEIKRQIASFLVNHMINENLIEFTSMISPQAFETVYNARCILLPDTNVRMVRERM